MIGKNTIKWIKSLEMKKNRKREQLFVAEGPKVVGDLLAHYRPRAVFATSEWEGTIVYRTHKDGQINKFVEKYVKDTQHNNCVTTPTRFIPIDYLYNFVYNNVEVEGEYFKLQEVLIDNLEPETPLGGNFG